MLAIIGSTIAMTATDRIAILVASIAAMLFDAPVVAAKSDALARCQSSPPSIAVIACTEILKLIPDSPMPLQRRASAHFALRNLDAAFSDYSAVLRVSPQNFAARYERGQVLLELGRYDRAIKDFAMVISSRPSWSAAWNGRAWAHYQAGQIEPAMRDVTEALRLAPDDVAALDTRAQSTSGSIDAETLSQISGEPYSLSPSTRWRTLRAKG